MSIFDVRFDVYIKVLNKLYTSADMLYNVIIVFFFFFFFFAFFFFKGESDVSRRSPGFMFALY